VQNLFDDLQGILKADDRFFSNEGNLLRNVVYSAAMQGDTGLLKLLLANEATKKRFFTDVDGVLVFNQAEFTNFINNRDFLPDSYTRFKKKIGLAKPNGDLFSASGDVTLVFPYKDCVLEGGQTKEDQKRGEIFYNETLAPEEIDRLLYPKVLVNAKRYTKDGEAVAKEVTDKDNLIIKGNNLLAVSSLREKYRGKIKCIYIDPPYNPESAANTFCYNNTFNRSTWLVFMKTRLQIAKELLKRDGVLIVAIDKNEQPRLQILIEEIYPDYDVDCITIIHNPRGTIGTNFSYTHEFAIFVTPKGKKTIAERKLTQEEVDWSPLRNWGGESLRTDAKNCFYPILVKNEKIIGFGDVSDNDFHPVSQTVEEKGTYSVYPIDSNGIERKWRYARQTVDSIIDVLRVKKTKTGYDIELGKKNGMQKTVWTDSRYDASVNGTQLLKTLVPDAKFAYPKSLYTVVDCINAVVSDDKDALILDFFAGSGTTGHAVMEINQDGGNRHFILVEQMNYMKDETLKRNIAVMKQLKSLSSIVFCELAKCNQKYIDAAQSAKTDADLVTLLKQVVDTAFISANVFNESILKSMQDFEALPIMDKRNFINELLDKNMLYVNLCDMNDEDYGITDADKAFTRSFYEKAN
jgi:adenine-specific DNA-methyltransferase